MSGYPTNYFKKDMYPMLESARGDELGIYAIDYVNDTRITFEVKRPQKTLIEWISGILTEEKDGSVALDFQVGFYIDGTFAVEELRLIKSIIRAAVTTERSANIDEVIYDDGDIEFNVTYKYADEMRGKTILDQIETYLDVAEKVSEAIEHTLRTLGEEDDDNKWHQRKPDYGAPYSEDYTGYR